MQPGDPQTVAAWSPATGQLAMKGGFLSWSSDGGHTLAEPDQPGDTRRMGPVGRLLADRPDRLVSSRGPGFSSAGPTVPVDLTWDPSAGQIPSVMATAVFRERVLIRVRDAALESVATDGSGTARLDIAAWLPPTWNAACVKVTGGTSSRAFGSSQPLSQVCLGGCWCPAWTTFPCR
jgi:hypothetical protein